MLKMFNQGISMVKFWWDLSMTLQIADLSLYHHVAEKQKANFLVFSYKDTHPIHEDSTIMISTS